MGKSRFSIFLTFSATFFCEYLAIYEAQVTLEWPTWYQILRETFLTPIVLHLGPIDREIFAKSSRKRGMEKLKISNFTFLNWWISRLKSRSRLTFEWPNLYEILRGTFSTPAIFHLGLIDREIFAKVAQNLEKIENLDFHLFKLMDF